MAAELAVPGQLLPSHSPPSPIRSSSSRVRRFVAQSHAESKTTTLRSPYCASLAATFCVAAAHQIRWAHGVNSRRKLRAALQNREVHMIESDICIGTFRDRAGTHPQRVVAAHYPTSSSSDLPVEKLLDLVLRHNASGRPPKGLKLDFKQLPSVKPTMSQLLQSFLGIRDRRRSLNDVLPAIFLNADVVRGGCPASKVSYRLSQPLPFKELLEAIQAAFNDLPEAARRCALEELSFTLSLGWTPGVPVGVGRVITQPMALEMLEAKPLIAAACENGWLRHVTFAVSAACAASSSGSLTEVFEGFSQCIDCSLSFFTPTFGLGLRRKEIATLHNCPVCGPDRMFLDIKTR